MATSGGGSTMEVKTHFTTREGVYKNLPNTEFCRMNRVPYSAPLPPGQTTTTAPVKGSIVTIEHEGMNLSRLIFIVGKDVFYYDYEGAEQPADFSSPLDRRVYKGVMPTCHSVNELTASLANVSVAVGFAAGQVQIIDVGSKQSLQILNEERAVEKAAVTCVHWVPDSENVVMSSHANGIMYTYDISHKNLNVVPVYHEKPKKISGDVSIYTLKNKHYATQAGVPLGYLKNPTTKWVIGHENPAVHEFQFSPDGKTVAIVSQDGYLRLVDFETHEKKGAMKSYFGGLLCCCWSPDGRYIVTGGEDDLVTVYSFYGAFVLARGHGHRSWISSVAFDKYLCFVPEEDDVLNWYGSDSPALVRTNTKSKVTSHHSDHDSSNLISNKKDLKSPVTKFQDMTRRHRTESTVSRKSNLSIAESMDAPPRICYRFGSAGQDAQMCLWEITDDVLFPRRRTVSMIRSHGCTHFIRPKPDVTTMTNGTKERDSYYSDSSAVTNSHTQLNSVETKGKHAKLNGSPPVIKDTSHSISRGFTLFSSKDRSLDVTEGKFATLAGGENMEKKEHAKEHKRNLSMPYFGLKNSHKNHANANGSMKTDQGKIAKPALTLGTTLCPRLEETAMLDPLVCKTIAQGRLTWLSFQKDSFIIACQDGCLQTWARPLKSSVSIPQTVLSNDLPQRPLNSPTPTPKLSPSKSLPDDEANRQR